MKNFMLAVLLGLLVTTSQAQEKATPQQERMKNCNTQAGEKKLKGDERKTFMSSCLKGEGEKKTGAQQDKMKSCNKEASGKGLKGDERKKFMSQCLKA
jgi:hypothetical protein